MVKPRAASTPATSQAARKTFEYPTPSNMELDVSYCLYQLANESFIIYAGFFVWSVIAFVFMGISHDESVKPFPRTQDCGSQSIVSFDRNIALPGTAV